MANNKENTIIHYTYVWNLIQIVKYCTVQYTLTISYVSKITYNDEKDNTYDNRSEPEICTKRKHHDCNCTMRQE